MPSSEYLKNKDVRLILVKATTKLLESEPDDVVAFLAKYYTALQAGGTEEIKTLDEMWAVLDKDNSGSLTAAEVWKGVKKGLFARIPGLKGLKSGEIMDILDTDAGEDSTVTKEEFGVAMRGVFAAKNPGVPPPPALGTATPAEKEFKMPTTLDEMWTVLDKDKSGSLTSAEVWKGVKKGLFATIPGFVGLKSGEIMDILDTDAGEDSKVTKEEFRVAMRWVFITKNPGVPPPPALGPATPAEEEFKMPTTLDEMWAVLDKDNSGSLTAKEVWKGVKKGLFAAIAGFKGLQSGEIMDILDTDAGEDSKVTKEEFGVAMRGVFATKNPGVPPPPALGPATPAETEFKMPTTLDEMWAVLDKDKSGSLSAAEVWKGVKKGLFATVPGFVGLTSGEIMDLLDTDAGEDSKVTKEEFGVAMRGVFTTKNPGVPPPPALGPTTPAEEEFKMPTTLDEMWAVLDKDNGGSLSAAEVWKGVKKGLFATVPGFIGLDSGEIMDKLDTDAGEDSKVTKDEFVTAMAVFTAH